MGKLFKLFLTTCIIAGFYAVTAFASELATPSELEKFLDEYKNIIESETKDGIEMTVANDRKTLQAFLENLAPDRGENIEFSVFITDKNSPTTGETTFAVAGDRKNPDGVNGIATFVIYIWDNNVLHSETTFGGKFDILSTKYEGDLFEQDGFLYAIEKYDDPNFGTEKGVNIYKYLEDTEISTFIFPDEIDGYPVIEISNGFFNDYGFFEYESTQNSIQNVVFPEFVRTIGATFSHSENLEHISFSGTDLKEIESFAFSGCRNLNNVYLPQGIEKIGVDAFYSCDSFTEFIIPSTMQRMGDYMPGGGAERVVSGKNLSKVINYSDKTFPIEAITQGGYTWSLDQNGVQEVEIIPANSTLYRIKKNSSSGSSGHGGGSSGSSSFSGGYSSHTDSLGMQITKENTFDGSWEKVGENWRLKQKDGNYAKSQWAYIDNKWYLIDGNCNMRIGWQLVNGKWYYLNADGSMANGWILLNGIWYWLDPTGEMVTGWKWINEKCYYFDSSGAMWYNTTTPDGYFVDADGAWVQ